MNLELRSFILDILKNGPLTTNQISKKAKAEIQVKHRYSVLVNSYLFPLENDGLIENIGIKKNDGGLVWTLNGHVGNIIEEEIERINNDTSIEETDKEQLVKSRVGQGKFRGNLLKFWKDKCAITEYPVRTMLVASHIKPWTDSSNEERLDKFNGLLLVANIDRAFDRGLISFKPDGVILISHLLQDPETIGIHKNMKLVLMDEHQLYMSYHRDNVFKE